ncbi:MAG: phosphatidylinositol-specific phospholipase C/glycerophosphodiester phosphodiesterase family protein [Niabella sp.]
MNTLKYSSAIGICIAFFLLTAQPLVAQKHVVVKGHSHNDYEQQDPFWSAYNHGFSSIEADVFLADDNLPVAHAKRNISPEKNLRTLYLEPLSQCVKKNKGSVYPNRSKNLLLLIDCKTEGISTLQEIIRELRQFPELISNRTLKFVITGNQPHKDSLFRYPAFIWFDGNLNYSYNKKNLKKIALFSANFRNYSAWNGVDMPDKKSAITLQQEIKKAHQLKKPVRFWGAPDNENAWNTFLNMGIDFINTDRIKDFSTFAERHTKTFNDE